MTVLSDSEIIDMLQEGRIVIHPFDPRNVNTSSYDVSLGEFFFREIKPVNVNGDHQFFNIYSKAEVDRVWGSVKTADRAEDWMRWHPEVDWTGISRSDHIIMLPPRSTILAHTKEFIGGRILTTTMMKARSSFGRSFIEVCKCAGYGDVGYFNRWTMEITNNSEYYHIPLVVGRRIAQIVFLRTGGTARDYASDGGKYQESNNLRSVIESWRPEMMPPRLHTDRDIGPDVYAELAAEIKAEQP